VILENMILLLAQEEKMVLRAYFRCQDSEVHVPYLTILVHTLLVSFLITMTESLIKTTYKEKDLFCLEFQRFLSSMEERAQWGNLNHGRQETEQSWGQVARARHNPQRYAQPDPTFHSFTKSQ
jgi:hypothetical protein